MRISAGNPKNQFIPVSSPLITRSDRRAVDSALKSGWVSGDGPVIETFEQNFATIVNRKHGIAVANGTVAIDLLVAALDIQPGDEVILPSFTIISCLSAILRSGAKPVFVDSENETWNMNVHSVGELINSRTKAIIAVHVYGLPTDMSLLTELAEKHGIPIIEDAAEAHGLYYGSQPCGSFGLASTFSFYANKNITTGEGGMIVTDNDDLAANLRNLRNLNFRRNERFVSDELGWNARLSSLQAALGNSQLFRLEKIVKRRREIANRYLTNFSNSSALSFQPLTANSAMNSYWVVGALLKSHWVGRAKELASKLTSTNIGTRPFFQPLHRQPVLVKYGFETQPSLPIAENLGGSGLYLPNGLAITNSQIDYVSEVVLKIIKE